MADSSLTNHNQPPSNRLEGRVSLISGGAQGIGYAIAVLFQRQGSCVSILDCDDARGNAAAAELTAKNQSLPVRFIRANLANQDEIQDAVKTVRRLYDRVDILVNNAGIEMEKPLSKLTVEDWDSILNVNLRGAFLLTQATAPLFPGSGGAIVNISSIHATHAFPNAIPYACSKAGLVALTRNLALELAPRRIRVNCICPGYIDTRLWSDYLRSSPDPEAVAAQTTALHPIGRRGETDDVAEAALFLAAESSSFITGADLVVDGGLTVRAHP